MNKKSWLIIGIVAIVLLIVVNFNYFVKEEDSIKIGIMTITTGDLAFLGQNIVDSAMLAREELGYENKNSS